MKLDNVKYIINDLISWIDYKMKSIGAKRVVIGISGGKDSSTVAALMVRALGKENVFGVLMPNGVQSDIDYAIELCEFLDIKYKVVQIEGVVNSLINSISFLENISNQTHINIPPRVRMTTLYAISQSIENSVVINTSNLSEDWIGFATIYGDTTGAFSPLATFTTDEVIQIAIELGLDEKFVYKKPADGLTGKTDEEVFGFSYNVLNEYIRTGHIEDITIKEKIDLMNKKSRFKFSPIDMYNSKLPIAIDDIGGVYK